MVWLVKRYDDDCVWEFIAAFERMGDAFVHASELTARDPGRWHYSLRKSYVRQI